MTPVAPLSRHFEVALFLLCWFLFAYFNQGGGWNQNARFAEVRAIVEEGRCAIDNFLVYRRAPADAEDLERLRVEKAEYTYEGQRYRLCWVDAVWQFTPVGTHPLGEGVKEAPMVEMCASGDIGYVEKTGHFHPNKPPGTSFLAVPAYFVIFHVERALGINPDHWFTLNVNCWLTTILTTGLASAIGCVLFFRLAREFAGGAVLPALLATFALAFGTTFLPFGTILFDHNLTAVLLLAAFYLLRKNASAESSSRALLFLGGLCAGVAAITNYVAAVAVIFLGCYVLLASGSILRLSTFEIRRGIFYSLGVVPPFFAICAFNFVNFGSPFALSNDFQNPLFADPKGALGMFALPDPYVALVISVSPYRGLFLLCPVLILAVAGWVVWLREKTFVTEARLGIAIFGFFFLVNTAFNGYHGGFSAGPRYLIPGIPFLALPLVVAFVRWRKTSAVLLALSVGQQFLLTATDAQNSLAVGGHARIDDAHRKDDFLCSIVGEYAAPLFFTGRVGALTEQMLAIRLENEEKRVAAEMPDLAQRAQHMDRIRREWREAVDRREPAPLLLAAIRGPVSVNPVNVFDGLLGYGVWPLGTRQTDWASFNAGEFLFPMSRLSVLPVGIVALVGGALLIRRAAKIPASPAAG